MTDRTERNIVFSTKKIKIIATLFLIFNYAFVIGIRLCSFFWEFPDINITSCVDSFETDQPIPWLMISAGVYPLIVTLFGLYTDISLNR